MWWSMDLGNVVIIIFSSTFSASFFVSFFVTTTFAPFCYCTCLPLSCLYYFVKRGSLSNSISSASRASPLSFFIKAIYFFLNFFAFSARPGSLSSQFFWIAFSRSSFYVSLIRTTVLVAPWILKIHAISLVSSERILQSGQSLISK